MTPARVSLLLLTAVVPLAVAACATERKPIRGFDKPPPGSIVLETPAPDGGAFMLWPMLDLPLEPLQPFRPRLNGKDAVIVTSQDGFYDYVTLNLQGWTAGWNGWLTGIPPATYVVDLVDGAGQSWGQSAPLAIPSFGGDNVFTAQVQIPAVIFAHFDGKVTSWNVEPALQDADPATDEITVTNMIGEDVVVERCQIVSGSPTSCAVVGTVAPGGDLRTVETAAGTSKVDHQALRVRLTSDASQSYQRDLVTGTANFVPTCQVERIIVHGNRSLPGGTPTGLRSIAMSSCYGYGSGPVAP